MQKMKSHAVREFSVNFHCLHDSILACASDEFRCAIGGGCIKKEQTCDGVPQCADQSDEWNCWRLEKETDNKKILEVFITSKHAK